MALCEKTQRNVAEGGNAPKKTIQLEPRPAAEDLSAEAPKKTADTGVLGSAYSSESASTENSIVAVESRGSEVGSGSSPAYMAKGDFHSPSNAAAAQPPWTDNRSGASAEIEVSTGPAGRAQKSGMGTDPLIELAMGTPIPMTDPFYTQLHGIGHVELRVPERRLAWGEEKGEEPGQNNIVVLGENNVQCQVMQRVYGADGEHSLVEWMHPVSGMYIWWWACTIVCGCA